jgi:hypothetical protein
MRLPVEIQVQIIEAAVQTIPIADLVQARLVNSLSAFHLFIEQNGIEEQY